MKLRAGIFFGGPSREREISFAGGRMVYDCLDQSMFEPVPVFVDSHKNLVLLNWPLMYKESIGEFYPPAELLPYSPNEFRVYIESLGELSQEDMNALVARVGRRVRLDELPGLIDFAFLTMHGEYGADGRLQRQLDDLGIPYSGSGIQASEIGSDKTLQKDLLPAKGFNMPQSFTILREQWVADDAPGSFFRQAADTFGFPLVLRPANQGSSIGVSVVDAPGDEESFRDAVNRAFFREIVPVSAWRSNSKFEKTDYLHLITELRDGLGFPVTVTYEGQQALVYHPESLLAHLDELAHEALPGSEAVFVIESAWAERAVIVEEFVYGREFSCVVVRNEDGSTTALPPTEISKGPGEFDVHSNHMTGMSRRETPIQLPEAQMDNIRRECTRLFQELGFGAYARIDGFVTDDGRILINDPNNTSPLLPASLLFHQAAEIGLNATQFLTFIVRASIQERMAEHPERAAYADLLQRLDTAIGASKNAATQKRNIAIVFGSEPGDVESARNVFEKLSASDNYAPFPVLVADREGRLLLFRAPLGLLFYKRFDDLGALLDHWQASPVLEAIRQECAGLLSKYTAPGSLVSEPKYLSIDELQQSADAVFLTAQGLANGSLQKDIESRGMAYTGSDAVSAAIAGDKYRSLQTLKRNGFKVPDQIVATQTDYEANAEEFYRRVESMLSYPFAAKPVDGGHAAKVLKDRRQLEAYTRMMFRPERLESEEARRVLRLRITESIPRRQQILFEAIVTQQNALQILEIKSGLLTRFAPDGALVYEVFDPSEVPFVDPDSEWQMPDAGTFLVTPARFASNPEEYRKISLQVKGDLERAARILGVQGYALVSAFVRIFEDGRAETVIADINPLPALTPKACLLRQAAFHQYKPYDFIDQVLHFAFDRKALASGVQPAAAVAPSVLTELPMPTVTDEPEMQQSYFDPATRPQQVSYAGEPGAWRDTPRQSEPRFEGSSGRVLTYYLSEMAQFLRSGIFLRNLLGLAAFVVVGLLLLQLALRLYTRHSESVQVHDYVGMTLNEAISKARSRNFRIVVTDSIFKVDARPNIVLEQSPSPLSRVKERRRIYLTVTKTTPDMVALPDMVGSYNYDQYSRKLAWVNVRSKVRERKFDEKLEENTILHFFYDGKQYSERDVRNGLKVPMGATLEFVVTERLTGMVAVPDLVCKTYEEALFIITSFNLNIGTIHGDGPGSDQFYIWKQEPAFAPGVTLSPGRQIDLYLAPEKPADCGVPAPEPEQEEDGGGGEQE
ncbi:MAG: PASTA domain-containing protein [Saprospiraceae bacterium]|nr:PASTA domain-containing protein [Saprospiraceae bacterium]